MKLQMLGVGKQYNHNFWGLREFHLELDSGILGLLGPNGAGKSTLMRILATITEPTEGIIFWNGISITEHPNDLRKVLGYLPQHFGVYPNLNALEFLQYMAAIKGLNSKIAAKRIDELLQIVNLQDVRKRPLKRYSGGMKQRIGIAQALLNDPQLLIVDEPTVGLDPEERVRFRNLLADLSDERIVILSTHIVSDVEAIAQKIALISKGKLIKHDTPENLLKMVTGLVWEWLIPNSMLKEVKDNYLISSIIRSSGGLRVRIVCQKKPNLEAQKVTPCLEDAYLYVIHNGGKNYE